MRPGRPDDADRAVFRPLPRRRGRAVPSPPAVARLGGGPAGARAPPSVSPVHRLFRAHRRSAGSPARFAGRPADPAPRASRSSRGPRSRGRRHLHAAGSLGIARTLLETAKRRDREPGSAHLFLDTRRSMVAHDRPGCSREGEDGRPGPRDGYRLSRNGRAGVPQRNRRWLLTRGPGGRHGKDDGRGIGVGREPAGRPDAVASGSGASGGIAMRRIPSSSERPRATSPAGAARYSWPSARCGRSWSSAAATVGTHASGPPGAGMCGGSISHPGRDAGDPPRPFRPSSSKATRSSSSSNASPRAWTPCTPISSSAWTSPHGSVGRSWKRFTESSDRAGFTFTRSAPDRIPGTGEGDRYGPASFVPAGATCRSDSSLRASATGSRPVSLSPSGGRSAPRGRASFPSGSGTSWTVVAPRRTRPPRACVGVPTGNRGREDAVVGIRTRVGSLGSYRPNH